MKKNVIFILVVLLIIVIIYICNNKSNINENINENNYEIQYIQDTTKDNEKDDNKIKEEINEIKSKVNATANTEMYEIQEEYDGRKIIKIKDNIQIKTIIAGILKNSLPNENEIEEILKKLPQKNGIWVSNNSRNTLLKILQENNLNNYKIDEQGYLYNENNTVDFKFKQIDNAINSEKLYILDFSGVSYIRDEITGIIIENPFEQMDERQVLEKYSDDKIVILEIIKNNDKRFTSKEILQEILINIE